MSVEIALLTGGIDRPYAYGLATALASKDVHIDVIGNEVIDSPALRSNPNITFFNLWPPRRSKYTITAKSLRTVRHYAALVQYAMSSTPCVFHILWNSKVQLIDRTALMLYYKILGKHVVLTAHNTNQGKRDANDSTINRLTLKIQYRLADHIFVHTPRMKTELCEQFGVTDTSVTVIRHPVNNAFPETDLSRSSAKQLLGVSGKKTILFLGRIKPYKGVELLLEAYRELINNDSTYRLIIAGEVQHESEEYVEDLKVGMRREMEDKLIILHPHFIQDKDIEIYLKGADVLVLPYNNIFQSGILFLAYSFGVPVIATDVGSFRDDILEGVTGHICKPGDSHDLANSLTTYFSSDLYHDLNTRREEIKEYAKVNHSWDAVAETTRCVYAQLMKCG